MIIPRSVIYIYIYSFWSYLAQLYIYIYVVFDHTSLSYIYIYICVCVVFDHTSLSFIYICNFWSYLAQLYIYIVFDHTSLNYIYICMYISLHVKYPLFLSDCNENFIFTTDSRTILKYKILWKSAQRDQSCSLRTDRQTDRRKDRHDKTNIRFSQFCERDRRLYILFTYVQGRWEGRRKKMHTKFLVRKPEGKTVWKTSTHMEDNIKLDLQ